MSHGERNDGRALRCSLSGGERTPPPVGGTALLFTDGLVEDRRVLLDVNLEILRAAAGEAADADAEAFANHVLSIFGPREDDVAMVVLRRTG